ncbi:MAG: PhzF family phenazine biosynthesis protein [Methylococcales symbiont of Iophon sp. n. MRB-2018]|nr:MAG: PhzF family phenazine biosynthesis protein [Methylococcales symbiont of Iophon sp. n. MRB-2018]KAF3980557.1 MAG: PhzF family phenazine biosynthesis protein [Methylococcales symbiont of Iophon sp. n. MRB-2018]
MKLSLYQIDAFANKPFEGNPAAICSLDEWLSDDLMQSIATENNLSETAFFVKTNKGYSIRWFTPVHEVDLCGHATLASAYVIFNILKYEEDEILFESKSGLLKVKKNKDWLEMNFPSQPPIKCPVPKQLLEAFDEDPIECLRSEDYVLVFKNEESILNANPNMSLLSELDLRGVVITSTSESYDFISRFFAPKYGINEDPVTGSSFTQLIPYWSKKLDKQTLNAKQVSKRGGEVGCTYLNERVKISGRAIKYMDAVIEI